VFSVSAAVDFFWVNARCRWLQWQRPPSDIRTQYSEQALLQTREAKRKTARAIMSTVCAHRIRRLSDANNVCRYSTSLAAPLRMHHRTTVLLDSRFGPRQNIYCNTLLFTSNMLSILRQHEPSTTQLHEGGPGQHSTMFQPNPPS